MIAPEHVPYEHQYVPNQHCPNLQVICGGQPSSDQLAAFAKERGHTVVNLRTDDEMATLRGWDEGRVVRSLGMRYVRIPVRDETDLTHEACVQLGKAMAPVGGEPIMVHCASGQRVAALMALKSVWIDQQPIEVALQIGRDAGLDRMEPQVQKMLNEHHEA